MLEHPVSLHPTTTNHQNTSAETKVHSTSYTSGHDTIYPSCHRSAPLRTHITMSASPALTGVPAFPNTATATPPPTTPDNNSKTYDLAIALPRTADTTLYIRLTVAAKHLLLFLSTRSSGSAVLPVGVAATGDGGENVVHPMRAGDAAVPRGKVPLGSFVYAMPSMSNEKETVCTPLIPDMATLETAERVARILARRVRRPVYVGSSMSLAGMGGGGNVEEEMGVVGAIVKIVAERVPAAATAS
ncbi:hypothetical protein Dda_2221 [Drechslerella dactyloides]|uniref:Uncharacterized protein n=1 Tax=Drechslerella dactyloides TaxID=74499 RepID=A0AAD6J342_DREDA|nr:hypothetical protein Dda_2221 [Drechslerella dactyloides]